MTKEITKEQAEAFLKSMKQQGNGGNIISVILLLAIYVAIVLGLAAVIKFFIRYLFF